jgi:hypothetical protein
MKRPGDTDAPNNTKELFKNSVPDENGKNWYAKDKDGSYHRFAPTGGNSNEAHWNGTTASDRSIVVPTYVKERLKNK